MGRRQSLRSFEYQVRRVELVSWGHGLAESFCPWRDAVRSFPGKSGDCGWDEMEGGKTRDRATAVICEVGRGWICGKGLNQRKYVR